jgi:hypothetical protein
MHVLGLPAHPLLVHVPVIAVPLSMLGIASSCWRRNWLKWFLAPLAALAIVAAVFAFFAAESGSDLNHEIRPSLNDSERHAIHEHEQSGELARNLAIAFAATTVVFGVTAILVRRGTLPPWGTLLAYMAAVAVGIAATVGMVLAGHSGADAVWDSRIDAINSSS